MWARPAREWREALRHLCLVRFLVVRFHGHIRQRRGFALPLQSGKTRRGRTMREVMAYKGKDGGMVEFAEAK